METCVILDHCYEFMKRACKLTNDDLWKPSMSYEKDFYAQKGLFRDKYQWNIKIFLTYYKIMVVKYFSHMCMNHDLK